MIKVEDIAYVRFAAPDLQQMERFLGDFGLVVSEREGGRLYARGTDPSRYLHVTEPGEPAFRGVAFEAASAEDLLAASELEGASGVEPIDAPGGGRRVRFTDPDGFQVEVVHGREPLPPLPPGPHIPVNRGSERRRLGDLVRIQPGPARVKRLGHAVLRVRDFRTSEAWYKSRFGFLSSDEVYLGDEQNVITSFLRCDRGDAFTDHHTFLCIGTGEPAFDHAAFEVEDMDAVMTGHDHLAKAGYRHHAGVGRHVLGSQVFDYWCDPWGHVLEHFTDGDLLNASHETGRHSPAVALGTQWGKFAP
jgi:catechol 2,3-dioxygenase-like lactoylglutathione lyase family enzyme